MLSVWRHAVKALGFDFGDGLMTLLDLRFADDLFPPSKSLQDVAQLLGESARGCSSVGLCPNATTTQVLTTHAQSPSQLITPAGHIVDTVPPNDAHRWLGCLLSCRGSKEVTSADVDSHVQVASKAYLANEDVRCYRNISLTKLLQLFDTVITPVALWSPRSFPTRHFFRLHDPKAPSPYRACG